MPNREPSEHYEVTFTPTGDGPPAIARVRRMLKLSLRACGLRCVTIRHLTRHNSRPEPRTRQKGK